MEKIEKTVLVVEDEAMSRWIIANTLKRHGIPCLEAEHGKHALEILSQNPCDFILTDLQMPEMDGVELIRTLREREKTTCDTPMPIVVLSAEKGEMIETALQLGVHDYFIKSVPFESFMPRLKKLLST